MVHLHLSSRFFWLFFGNPSAALFGPQQLGYLLIMGGSLGVVHPLPGATGLGAETLIKWRQCIFREYSCSGGKVDNAKPLRKWDCWMSSS